jgi:two-component system sensor histidine kinase PilS (NtrC family)
LTVVVPVAGEGDWQRLWGISAYRLLITAAIALLVQLPVSDTVIDLGRNGALLRALTLAAAVISLAYLAAVMLRRPAQARLHAFVQVGIDTLLVLALLHFGGGLNGPFSILPFLLLVSTASLLRGQSAFVFVWVLLVLLLMESLAGGMALNHPPLGQILIYVLALIAVAVLADSLVASLERSTRLANQRGAEVLNLNALSREIVQHMDVGVMVLDQQSRVILSNPIARLLSGYRYWMEAPIPLDLVHPRLATAARQPMGLADEATRTGDPALEAVSRTVVLRHIALPDSPFRLLLLQDASQLRARERELQLAALGRLAANIAHEIRNPLSAIRHAAGLLGERVQEPAALRLCHILEREALRINAIVESVLEMARPGPAHPEALSLRPYLSAVVEQLREDPVLRPLQVDLILPQEDLVALADPAHLRQILWNLLHNAVRHGAASDGSARLQISVAPSDKGEIVLELRDFGPGIDGALGERIFEPFFTTDSRGTGLGLSMVRELLRLNGGRIETMNHPGGGAVFRLILPQDAAGGSDA